MATPSTDKKRKRHSEKDDRPKKKAAVNGSSPQPQANSNASDSRSEKSIKLVHLPQPEHDIPVIATTPGIALPTSISLSAYRKRKPTSELLLHSSNHPRVDYTAREQKEGGVEGLLKHYIGIYDASAQEMQLIEARKMSIRSTLRSEEAAVREEKLAQRENNTPLTKRQQLGLEFGTKKAQKAIRSITENAVSSSQLPPTASQQDIESAIKSNPSASAVLESMTASADAAPSKESLQAIIDDAKPRPKHNPDAKTVEDVYPITSASVMGEEFLQLVKVKPWFEAIEGGKNVSTTSRFVANRIKELILGREDGGDAVKKVKVCRYLLVLIQFYKALKPPKKGGVRLLPKPEVLREKVETESVVLDVVKRRFASGGDLSKWHIDNLLTHIAVLSLYIDDFESDTCDLREDLGLSQRTLEMYFKEVGAKVAAMTEKQRSDMKMTKDVATLHRIAKLKLPLEFPKQRIVPLKGRR